MQLFFAQFFYNFFDYFIFVITPIFYDWIKKI